MVALNDRSLTDSRFNDIGIDGTLCQKVDLADLPPLILKDTDEFLADNFAFAFRIRNAFEPGKKTAGSIDADKVDLAVAKDLFNLVASFLRIRP